MQNIGIIAEFNPFHLGHEHLIKKAKEQNCGVVCVMSGNFVQRGDTAVIPKSFRAAAAVKCGADLVIELPTPFAMSTAQSFSESAVGLLEDLGVIDSLLFGSESADIEKISAVCELLETAEFEEKIKEKIKSGKTYASIRQEAIEELRPDLKGILENANDILATEYITALKRLNSKIKPQCIKRLGASHTQRADGVTASAGEIREKLLLGDYGFAGKYMPEQSFKILKNAPISDIGRLETAILVSLREKRLCGALGNLPDISEGLDNRFLRAVEISGSLTELYDNIKTKRYTLARIRRLVLNGFLGIDSSFEKQGVPYIRILAMSRRGEKIIGEISKKTKLPIIAAASDFEKLEGFAKKVFENEKKCTDIYALSLDKADKCGMEYYTKVFKGEI
ncbi:MAG: nucleotidyltransferase family protein [Clostridiales bacterium]|nr:nucleotidyltransferase family protein [Candidatus Equinaster intestinalis]